MEIFKAVFVPKFFFPVFSQVSGVILNPRETEEISNVSFVRTYIFREIFVLIETRQVELPDGIGC